MTDVPAHHSLTSMLRRVQRNSTNGMRSYGLHPSEFTSYDFCPVKRYYLEEAYEDAISGDLERVRRGVKVLRESLDAKAKTFSPRLSSELLLGHAIHELVQYEYGLIQVLYGVWECPHCHVHTQPQYMPVVYVRGLDGGPVQDPAPCPFCGGCNLRHAVPWRYVEPSIGWRQREQELGVAGHVDGKLFVPDKTGKRHAYVLEIKSINSYGYSEGKNERWENRATDLGWTPPPGYQHSEPNNWKRLPVQKHVSQASIYGSFLGIDKIWFVYVNKDQVSARRELIVDISQEALQESADRFNAVINARRNSFGPPMHLKYCPHEHDEAAKRCVFAGHCFPKTEVTINV